VLDVLVEGVASVIVGMLAIFALRSHIQDAPWSSVAEKTALIAVRRDSEITDAGPAPRLIASKLSRSPRGYSQPPIPAPPRSANNTPTPSPPYTPKRCPNSRKDGHEPSNFLQRVQAMLTFEDATAWSPKLLELIEEQLEIECPVCWAAMTIHLGGPRFFTRTSGFRLDTVTKRAPPAPKAATSSYPPQPSKKQCGPVPYSNSDDRTHPHHEPCQQPSRLGADFSVRPGIEAPLP
jgi:hypothetical protein